MHLPAKPSSTSQTISTTLALLATYGFDYAEKVHLSTSAHRSERILPTVPIPSAYTSLNPIVLPEVNQLTTHKALRQIAVVTYRQLAALANATSMVQSLQHDPLQRRATALPQSNIEAALTEMLTTPHRRSFESYLLTHTATPAVTLEKIVAHAEAQTLEETFAKLIYLTRETYAHVKPILPAIASLACDPSVETVPLTRKDGSPMSSVALIEKMLCLLRALGYRTPQEALVKFVARHGEAYLVDVLQVFCQHFGRSLDDGASAVQVSREDQFLHMGKLSVRAHCTVDSGIHPLKMLFGRSTRIDRSAALGLSQAGVIAS